MNKHTVTYKKLHNILMGLFVLFLLLLLGGGCGRLESGAGRNNPDKSNGADSQTFSDFTDRCFKELVASDSISLHFKLSDPASMGISEDNPGFGDLSLKGRQEDCREAAAMLDELRAFDRASLQADQQLTYDLLEGKLSETAKFGDYLLYGSLLGSNGVPSQIPVSLSEYYFNSEKDVKTYLALLARIPDFFEQLMEFEKERKKAGFATPDFVLSHTVDQIDQFLAGSREDNLLIETFDERIEDLEDLSEEQTKTYIRNNQAHFSQLVLPAYETLREEIGEELISKEDSDESAFKAESNPEKESDRTTESQKQETKTDPVKERICQYDRGKDYYRLLLKSMVGTERSPEECINVLKAQLKEITEDISSLNKANPDLYTDYLAAAPVLTDPEKILTRLQAAIKDDFPEIPEVSWNLKDLPASLSGTSASAFYLVPPIDDSRTNVIYVNRNRVDSQDIFSTLAHEGYPGHLYQTNYFLKTEPQPLRHLLRCSGYDEGWGTYAQLMSYQYEDFRNTDKDTTVALRQLGRDNDLLALTLSSLADLYVNYMDYDRDRLTEYLKPYGISPENVSSIYEYVIENPVSYLTYCMGCYELNSLKVMAEKEEGDAFDLRSFHERVLECGSCPFEIVKNKVLQEK
ncbi:MAG: DUF885 domain-containing protein [Eubacterium sp.]|nr:DUF885 domain-containing protein [Eubacterium sp.]